MPSAIQKSRTDNIKVLFDAPNFKILDRNDTIKIEMDGHELIIKNNYSPIIGFTSNLVSTKDKIVRTSVIYSYPNKYFQIAKEGNGVCYNIYIYYKDGNFRYDYFCQTLSSGNYFDEQSKRVYFFTRGPYENDDPAKGETIVLYRLNLSVPAKIDSVILPSSFRIHFDENAHNVWPKTKLFNFLKRQLYKSRKEL